MKINQNHVHVSTVNKNRWKRNAAWPLEVLVLSDIKVTSFTNTETFYGKWESRSRKEKIRKILLGSSERINTIFF